MKDHQTDHSRPWTRVPECQRRWLALLQTDQSGNQRCLCSREGPAGETKPAGNRHNNQRCRCAHLQDCFILQDGGEAIAKGHGAKQQDVKQVHLLFSGNLDRREQLKLLSCHAQKQPQRRRTALHDSAQCFQCFHWRISPSSSLFNHRKQVASNLIGEKQWYVVWTRCE